jgi:hypothetical protein
VTSIVDVRNVVNISYIASFCSAGTTLIENNGLAVHVICTNPDEPLIYQYAIDYELNTST